MKHLAWFMGALLWALPASAQLESLPSNEICTLVDGFETLAWDPPLVGTPSGYLVRVRAQGGKYNKASGLDVGNARTFVYFGNGPTCFTVFAVARLTAREREDLLNELRGEPAGDPPARSRQDTKPPDHRHH